MTEELKQRLLWAAVPGIFALSIILFAGPDWVFLISSLVALQGWREFARMMGLKDRPILHFSGYCFLFFLSLSSYFIKAPDLFWLWLAWAFGFFLLYFEPFIQPFWKRLWAGTQFQKTFDLGNPQPFDPMRDWTHLCRFILGIFYIHMIFGFMGPIAKNPNSGNLLLLLGMVVVFSGDTAAYFVGKKWGTRKLWPELSPNKTVEGALGGFVGSFGSAFLCFFLFKSFEKPLALDVCILVGLLAPPLGQAADFLESLMKRVSGRKDSGGLIPGHGGLLDRTDGLAFVMPLLYYLF